jgi:hypothetical protein
MPNAEESRCSDQEFNEIFNYYGTPSPSENISAVRRH